MLVFRVHLRFYLVAFLDFGAFHRVSAYARSIRRDTVCCCRHVVRARSDLASTHGDCHAPGTGNRPQFHLCYCSRFFLSG